MSNLVELKPVKRGKKIACYDCEHYVDGDEFCHKGKDMDRMNSRCKAWNRRTQ